MFTFLRDDTNDERANESNMHASTDGACFECERAGTSMATPTAAGNAALVRQYFTEGWVRPTDRRRSSCARSIRFVFVDLL
jgi:hypothetical protein